MGNTPPSIKEVSVYPEHPTSRSRAKVIINGFDRENDNIIYTVKWFVNGKEVAEGIDFSGSDLKRGDIIYAVVTPFDGKEYGKEVKTKVVNGGNTAPRIVEAKLEPDTIYTTTQQIKVSVRALDQDGDPLRYICHWYLGSEKLADTSTTLGNLRLKKGDRFTVDVIATDGESLSPGRVIYGSVANSPPVLNTRVDSAMTPAESFSYALPFSDPDGDKIVYTLISGPPTVQIDSKTGQISGKIEKSTPVEIRATDDEGAYLDVRFTLTPAKRE